MGDATDDLREMEEAYELDRILHKNKECDPLTCMVCAEQLAENYRYLTTRRRQ